MSAPPCGHSRNHSDVLCRGGVGVGHKGRNQKQGSVRELVTKRDGLSLIPRIHLVEERELQESRDPQQNPAPFFTAAKVRNAEPTSINQQMDQNVSRANDGTAHLQEGMRLGLGKTEQHSGATSLACKLALGLKIFLY